MLLIIHKVLIRVEPFSLLWFSFFVGALIFLILPLSSYSTFSSSVPLSHSDECSALLQFKNSLGVDTNCKLSQFCDHDPFPTTTTSNCCQWSWITCDLYTSHVTEIDLRNGSLTGSIDSIAFSNLFQLAHLESLYLDHNYLNGELPSSINITRTRGSSLLSRLSLSSNLLNGTIPSWISRLPSLKYLDLSSNYFTGSLNLFENASNSLKEIHLADNRIHGSIPESLFSFSNLRELSLSGNTLRGAVDFNRFSNLTHLQYLDLSNANLSVVITTTNYSSSTWAPKLSTLKLSSCNMSEFPYLLGVQGGLSELDLSNNNINGKVPEWMRDMGKDSSDPSALLNLSHNSLTGGLEHLPWNALYFHIDISSNLFQGSIPFWLAPKPKSLSSMHASNNRLDGTIDPSICNLTSLIFLDLSNNRLTGEIPQCLGNTSYELEVLNLESNTLEGTIPRQFLKCRNLACLDLSNNQLQGLVPLSLAQCTGLEFLNLGSNKLEDKFPAWLDALPNLLVLDLHSNNFHGHVVRNSKQHNPFSKVQILDLSYNNFSGELPTAYINNFKGMMNLRGQTGDLQYLRASVLPFYMYSIVLSFNGIEIRYEKIITTLAAFDLSSNRFYGEIPDLIGKLVSIRGLNLSHNRLTGSIPGSIASLTLLDSLDLSSNKLIGQIPQELTHLTFLGFFNVSDNQLTGTIPSGKPFDTFSADSYKGNLGLCGLPMPECRHGGGWLISSGATIEEPDQEKGEGGLLPEWKIVMMGYVCGTVIGLAWGYYMLSIGKPLWLVTWFVPWNWLCVRWGRK